MNAATALRILHDDLPNLEVTVLSQTSPELTAGLLRGTVDIAFIRRAERTSTLGFKLLVKEPIVVLMARDHPLAARASIRPRDLSGEPFVVTSPKIAPALRAAADGYGRADGMVATAECGRAHKGSRQHFGV